MKWRWSWSLHVTWYDHLSSKKQSMSMLCHEFHDSRGWTGKCFLNVWKDAERSRRSRRLRTNLRFWDTKYNLRNISGALRKLLLHKYRCNFWTFLDHLPNQQLWIQPLNLLEICIQGHKPYSFCTSCLGETTGASFAPEINWSLIYRAGGESQHRTAIKQSEGLLQ